jgi:DnaJ-class molecular chaperone
MILYLYDHEEINMRKCYYCNGIGLKNNGGTEEVCPDCGGIGEIEVKDKLCQEYVLNAKQRQKAVEKDVVRAPKRKE